MLAEYLDARGYPFMVPTSGAGPQASILGNALERGFGITPCTDHAAALTSVEAVLPDGSLYRSAFREEGGALVDRSFPWGIGPHLDGLFAQSNFGIVTEGSVALAPRPERVEGIFCALREDADIGQATRAIQGVLRDLGGIVGAINLMNDRRLLSMVEPYLFLLFTHKSIALAIGDYRPGRR